MRLRDLQQGAQDYGVPDEVPMWGTPATDAGTFWQTRTLPLLPCHGHGAQAATASEPGPPAARVAWLCQVSGPTGNRLAGWNLRLGTLRAPPVRRTRSPRSCRADRRLAPARHEFVGGAARGMPGTADLGI